MTLYRRLREQGKFYRKFSIVIFNLNFVFSIGVKKCIASKKEKLEEWHRKARHEYAYSHLNYTPLFWSKVTYIDEFSFNTGDPGQIKVWRERGTRFDQKNIFKNTRQTRISINFVVW